MFVKERPSSSRAIFSVATEPRRERDECVKAKLWWWEGGGGGGGGGGVCWDRFDDSLGC